MSSSDAWVVGDPAAVLVAGSNGEPDVPGADVHRARSAWDGLLTIRTRALDAIERELEAQTGLTTSAFKALLRLREAGHDGERMNGLADRLGLSRGGATKVVARLEMQGFAERRTPRCDRRATVARITPNGLTAIADAVPLHHGLVVEHLVRHLEGDDLLRLTEIARQLSNVEAPSVSTAA